jgi:xanthine dehydrogenase large subunit
MLIHVSTQHPSEPQHIVAHMLGLPNAAVTVEVRRMDCAFGRPISASRCSTAPIAKP